MTAPVQIFSAEHPAMQLVWSASSLEDLFLCDTKQNYRARGLSRDAPNFPMHAGRAYHECRWQYEAARFQGKNHDTALVAALRHLWCTYAPDAEDGDIVYAPASGWGPPDDALSPVLPIRPAQFSRHALARALVWSLDEVAQLPQHTTVTFRDGRAAIELPFEVAVPGTPFRVRGVLDRICTFGPDTLVEDYKLTGSTLSSFWFALHNLSVQVPLYDWAVRKAFPELDLQGVMIEGVWTGVTMCRTDRKVFHRNAAERAEFEADLIERLTGYAERAKRGVFPRAWNRTACRGCEYGPLCGRSPGAREIEEGAAYRTTERERIYE